jgi:hypothetical protein
MLLTRLREAGFKLNFNKSKFLQNEISFLGHHISTNGILPMPGKMNEIQNFPQPKNTKQMKSFLGTCLWVSKFIPHFATLAAPLYESTKSPKIIWTAHIKQAFESLKLAVKKIEILKASSSR